VQGSYRINRFWGIEEAKDRVGQGELTHTSAREENQEQNVETTGS
jgi:hypothetical protein